MPIQVRLTTTGRRSGRARQATLNAFEDGSSLVVVGSLGGAPRNPAWVHNLRADPVANVQRGGREWRARAREVGPDERDRLWRLVTEGFPLYESYQRRTERLIPLFVLDPLEE